MVSCRPILLVVLSLFVAGNSLYFHVTEGQERCFIEDLPKSELLVGTFSNPDYGKLLASNKGKPVTGIQILVKDPSGAQILEKNAGAKGRFAITSQVAGEHKICLSTNTSHWFGEMKEMRFSLKLDVGERATDYESMAKKEHLSSVEIEVRKLGDRARHLLREQTYQREREATFRDTSESTNSRVLWWSVLQTAVLLFTGIWQIQHLRNFFEAKKIV